MSRASCAPTLRSGIAVPGLTCCGSRIHRCILSGVFDRCPPIITRVAMPSSGGPTAPVAVRTFLSAWQLPQPYWMNIDSPRRGSPPVSAAAWMRIIVRCSAYSMTAPITATTTSSPASAARTSLVDGEPIGASFRCLQPVIGHDERRDPVNEPARDPHDQSGKPLIVDGIEADTGHAHGRVIGVPRALREAHQSPEGAADQRGD